MKSTEILQKHAAKQADKLVNPDIKGLSFWWTARVKTVFDLPSMKPLTFRETIQLRSLGKALGPDVHKVLDWVVNNWWKFAQEIKVLHGLPNVPVLPHIGLVLKYYDTAQNMIAVQSIATVPQVGGAPGIPAVVPSTVKKEPVHKMSDEEYQALMKELGG